MTLRRNFNIRTKIDTSRSPQAVKAEIIVFPSYEGQLHFHEFVERVHTAGFDLYGIYNISPPKRQIKQIDAIFIKRESTQI